MTGKYGYEHINFSKRCVHNGIIPYCCDIVNPFEYIDHVGFEPVGYNKFMKSHSISDDIRVSENNKNKYEWNKDFDGSRQDFIDYAEAKGFNPKVAGSTYETQHPENEEWQYGGELKANESFYDQALWIAKAKLEDGGLDIISALPDIIRNTRTSTGRDIDEDELSRAIEDAIDTYRNMLKTGMSMWGDRSTKASESYWGNQGQYQDLYSKYHSEIPDEGSVNDSLLEQLRIVSNVYYEVGNNGGGNMISGMGSAGEHGKINATIPETTWLVNRTEQTENSGGLEYEEEQELIRASLQELDGVVDNLLQQIKNDRADKDEQSNYWGESGQVEPDENWNAGRWTSGKGSLEDMYADEIDEDDLKVSLDVNDGTLDDVPITREHHTNSDRNSTTPDTEGFEIGNIGSGNYERVTGYSHEPNHDIGSHHISSKKGSRNPDEPANETESFYNNILRKLDGRSEL